VTGNILDDDYERLMTITLDNTTLTGAIRSGTCQDWNTYWLNAGYVEDYTIGLASNTFGSEEPLDAFVHDIVINDDGTYTETVYGDDQGTALVLTNGSVWTVTEASSLTALTVEAGSAVNGTVSVDGQVVDVTAGGSWSGTITVTPAASSGEPSQG
jgi:hypothetical protein